MKQTTNFEERHLTIEEITKLEAETLGQTLIKDNDFTPFRKNESESTFKNLLNGNERAINPETYVNFERRLRDIVENCVKNMIANNLSIFAIQQTDKGMSKFFDKNNGHSLITYTHENKDCVNDDKTRSTNWINYFSNNNFGKLPESLSEKNFIESIYHIFSYKIIFLRLQYHKENEGTKELLEISSPFLKFLKVRLIDSINYELTLSKLINNPTDIKQLKEEFKENDIFDSYEEMTQAIYFLTEFYSKLCEKISLYEEEKEERIKKQKLGRILRECFFLSKSSYSTYGANENTDNKEFLNALEVLRNPDCLCFLEKEFGNTQNSIFTRFKEEGSVGLRYEIYQNNYDEINDFIIKFVNSLIALSNSLESNKDKQLKKINSIEELEIKEKTSTFSFSDDFDKENIIFKLETINPYSYFFEKKISQSEKVKHNAINKIASTIFNKAREKFKDFNSIHWFEFLKSIACDKTFYLSDEYKTINFVTFINKTFPTNNFYNSAVNEFIIQILGIYEYKGFISIIEKYITEIKSLEEEVEEKIQLYKGNNYYEQSYLKTIKFIKESLLNIKKDAETEIKKNDSNTYFSWDCILSTICKSEYSIQNWKKDRTYNENELNQSDFDSIFSQIERKISFSENTFSTIIKDFFNYSSTDLDKSNTIIDKYKYDGLVEQNPFIHSITAMFYKFLYDFFFLLRTNINSLCPHKLNAIQILKYSLSTYVALFISCKKNYDKKFDKERLFKFTCAKYFVRKYFEYNEKTTFYTPSMRKANNELKNAAKKLNLKMDVFKALANLIDTKHKGNDLKSTPASSSYVLTQILTNNSLYPNIPEKDIRKYKTSYFNYYLICNFQKALCNFIEEDNVKKMLSEIIDGILDYKIYDDKYKDQEIKTGFEYLLHNVREDNNNKIEICSWNSFIKYPNYFLYGEDKDERLQKALLKYSLQSQRYYELETRFYELKKIDIMLAQNFIKQIRDLFETKTSEFYYYYFMGKLEYERFLENKKGTSLNSVISNYENAFKYIYSAGDCVSNFIVDVFHAYNITENGNRYNFDEPIKKTNILPLKKIWQWAEAAGLISTPYQYLNTKYYNGSYWQHYGYYNVDSDNLKRIERLVTILDSNNDF